MDTETVPEPFGSRRKKENDNDLLCEKNRHAFGHQGCQGTGSNRFTMQQSKSAGKDTNGTKRRDRRMTANNRLLCRSTSCHNIKGGQGSII
ncbi:hypothetical protein [Pseudaminobacter sp. NGMCC 1.201702]|uniref:hypothetical protein n=1 Tax=Pseudaminobacter sp. NGMCC 1.201702 TaxID=3391825 RepID=UPI0039EF501A